MNVLVTSQIQNVGKTSLSLLFALAFAGKNKKILLVDSDMGRYTLVELFDLRDNIYNKEMGVFENDLFGCQFDFAYCLLDNCVDLKSFKEYNYIFIDFDVSRSSQHADYFFANADKIVIPVPSWTDRKVADWNKRFKDGLSLRVEAEIIEYPIAVKYDDSGLSAIKWTNFKVYEAWKSMELDKFLGNQKQGIEYNEDWAKYISFREDYNKDKLKVFIQYCKDKIREDFKKWL